jgi:hypothetical protein
MADTTGYEDAKKRFEKAKEAYEKGRSSASAKEIQALLANYYEARRDMQERTPSGALGAGFVRTAGDVVTGIPDLLTEGVNWLAKKAGAEYQAPTLGSLFRQATGQSEGPKAAELADYYNAPGYTAAAYGIASLGKFGVQGLKAAFDNRKVNNLLKKLPEAEQNTFKDLMLRGQGSANTEVQAIINKARSNPKYAEIFNALDVAATERALPVPLTTSRITDQAAAIQAAKAVQNRLQKLAEERTLAGNLGFEKAFGYGEGRALVEPTKTIAEIDKLIGRYSKQASPNAAKAVEVLQKLKTSFETPSASSSAFSGVGGSPLPTTKMTVEEVQSILSEFGKKASSGDSLIKDLALSDEKIISSAVFGKMKDDLNVAFTNASGADRTALGFLQKARKDVEVASGKYNDAVAQGLPAWLKDKPLSSIDFEELMSKYSTVSPAQRATFREYVKANDPEALKNIDGRVWTDFKAKYTGELPDGSQGTDLARMAQDWNKMGLQEKDSVANALGQTLDEFSTRMKDALVFTRKARTGGDNEANAAADLVNKAAAVVGSTPAGYSGAKMTQLGGGILSSFRGGVISDDLAMKALMTPEGAAFLKQGKLTPGSMETLNKLMKTSESTAPTLSAPAKAALIGGVAAPSSQVQPMPAPVDDWVIPDETAPTSTTTTQDDWVIPD